MKDTKKLEIQAAAKSLASDCFDLEQSSPMYKALGVDWEKIAKNALKAVATTTTDHDVMRAQLKAAEERVRVLENRLINIQLYFDSERITSDVSDEIEALTT